MTYWKINIEAVIRYIDSIYRYWQHIEASLIPASSLFSTRARTVYVGLIWTVGDGMGVLLQRNKWRHPLTVPLDPGHIASQAIPGRVNLIVHEQACPFFDILLQQIAESYLLAHDWAIDWARFNVPPNTLYVISGTIFTGHKTKPTVSKHWRKPVGLSDKAWIGPLHHVTIIQL